MIIRKFIDIQQEVEIDVNTEDLTLIFEGDEENHRHIDRNLNNIHQILKAIPDKYFEQSSEEKKRTVWEAFNKVIQKFNPKP